jgi:hypothetical protein
MHQISLIGIQIEQVGLHTCHYYVYLPLWIFNNYIIVILRRSGL